MNTNFIKADGFSNPATEQFFRAHWTEERMDQVCTAWEHCGICRYAIYLRDSAQKNLWYLCLNRRSPYFHETVHFAFSCIHREPAREGQWVPCPWSGTI